MRSQLAGLLAEPLPWWFWAFAAGAGAWGVAEYSGAQKRKQEIATLAGVAVGGIAGYLLQPSANTSGLGATPVEYGRPAPLRARAVPPGIRPAPVHRRSWRRR